MFDPHCRGTTAYLDCITQAIQSSTQKVLCTEITAIAACYSLQDTRGVLCAGENVEYDFVYQSVQT